MKVRLQAGAELDLLSRGEVAEVLAKAQANWRTEVARGDRFRRVMAQATIANTAVTISGETGGATGNELGPAAGYVWQLNRLNVVGLNIPTETVNLGINGDQPGSLIKVLAGKYTSFQANEVVLYPNDYLHITASGLASTGVVTVTMQVREIPLPLAWRL